MPWLLVTSTHAAPMRSRYSCAWSSTLARSRLVSRRSRNCGTCALTALIPANVRVRAASRFATARRVFWSALSTAASAVRLAWSEVRPNVAPSTATTSSVDATKILPARPKTGALVALEALIRRVVPPVLVLVGLPLVAVRVEGDLEITHSLRRDGHVPDHLGPDPLVPDVQPVRPGRDVGDRERAVARRLGEPPVRHDDDVRHHARVHVAEHPHQAGGGERVGLRLTSAVQPQIELIR